MTMRSIADIVCWIGEKHAVPILLVLDNGIQFVGINDSKVRLFVPEREYNFEEVCLEEFRMLLPLKLIVLTSEFLTRFLGREAA